MAPILTPRTGASTHMSTTPIPTLLSPLPTFALCPIATTATFTPTPFIPTFTLNCSDLIIPANGIPTTTITITQTPETSYVISIPLITFSPQHPAPTRTYNHPYPSETYIPQVEQVSNHEFTLTLLRSTLETTLLDLTEKFAKTYNVTLGSAWEAIGKTLQNAEVVVGAKVQADGGKLEARGQPSTRTAAYTSLTIIPGPMSSEPEVRVPETKLSEVVVLETNLKPEVTVNGAIMG
ncbi:hypothetical protein EV426DRAFT_604544 [Tirmania nivea]|nr:hypothetical protein EV426DRAFT_604544 [Tirmania nivea]